MQNFMLVSSSELFHQIFGVSSPTNGHFTCTYKFHFLFEVKMYLLICEQEWRKLLTCVMNTIWLSIHKLHVDNWKWCFYNSCVMKIYSIIFFDFSWTIICFDGSGSSNKTRMLSIYINGKSCCNSRLVISRGYMYSWKISTISYICICIG